MKRTPNYAKHILQWGVLTAIIGTAVWARVAEKPVDVEKYCRSADWKLSAAI